MRKGPSIFSRTFRNWVSSRRNFVRACSIRKKWPPFPESLLARMIICASATPPAWPTSRKDWSGWNGLRRACRNYGSPYRFQDLLISEEFGSQPGIIDFLRRNLLINRQAGGGGRGLAEDHEDRLHPNRTVSDMRGGQTDGYKEVLAFDCLRHDGTVRDWIGF